MTRFLVGELMLVAIVASLGIGARAARRALVPGAKGATAWVAEITIALAALVLLGELLGTVGAFRPVPVTICAVALGLVSWTLLRHTPAVAAATPSPAPRPNRVVCWVGLGGCALVVAQWAAWTATPLKLGITDYDSLNYHLTFAAGFVQSGSIAPLHYVTPDSPVHLYPQTAELLDGVAMALLRSDFLVVLLNMGWLLLAILSGWAIGRRFGLGPATGLAVAAVMAVPVMAKTQAGTAGNDAAALALFLASLAIFVDAGRAPGPLIVSGLAAGLAVGTKLTVIAPCVLLGVAVVVKAGPRQRGRATLAWVGAAVVTGFYWYTRDLVITGSPDPAVHLGIGSLGFTYAPFRLVNDYGFSVAHYWGRPHVWGTMLIPGLASLGDAWPGVLAAVAIASGLALWRGRGLLRFLAVVATASTLVYLVTPTTAIGFDGGPSLYSQNLRYLTPALAAGLILVVLLAADRRYRPQLAIVGLIGLIVVVTLLPGSWTPWPSTPYVERTIALALGCAAAFLAGTLLPRFRRRFGTGLRAAVGVGTLCLLLFLAAEANRSYQRTRYTQDPLYSFVDSHLRHARIAIAGFDRQYPLYGSRWTNHVQYLGMAQPHGGFTTARSCRAWRRALAAGHYGYVVIRDDLLIEYPHGVPELAWTASVGGIKGEFIGDGAIVVRLTRPPRAALCPPGSSAPQALPSPHQRLGSPAA